VNAGRAGYVMDVYEDSIGGGRICSSLVRVRITIRYTEHELGSAKHSLHVYWLDKIYVLTCPVLHGSHFHGTLTIIFCWRSLVVIIRH